MGTGHSSISPPPRKQLPVSAAFVRIVAPTPITPASLEAAAREFSWEAEEPALLDIVDRAMSGAKDYGSLSTR